MGVNYPRFFVQRSGCIITASLI